MFFTPGTSELLVCTQINEDKSHGFTVKTLPMNEWTKIDVTHFEQIDGATYMLKIMCNNEVIHEMKNIPHVYKDVKARVVKTKLYAKNNFFNNILN